jgi:hypothetical protein
MFSSEQPGHLTRGVALMKRVLRGSGRVGRHGQSIVVQGERKG